MLLEKKEKKMKRKKKVLRFLRTGCVNDLVCYLWNLTQAGDLSGVGVYGEEHSSGLRRVRLQQLQGLVQSLGRE